MTPDTQHSAAIRSGALAVTPRGDDPLYPPRGEAARTGHWGAAARPSHASPQPRPFARSKAAAKRAQEDAGIVGVIPLLAVLVVTIAGVYIAWRQGSVSGGEGGVVAGIALLVGAVARLLLPARLAGLLATRKRATDVITLTVFGAGMLVAGLVLPR
jgi:hypothetical protein